MNLFCDPAPEAKDWREISVGFFDGDRYRDVVISNEKGEVIMFEQTEPILVEEKCDLNWDGQANSSDLFPFASMWYKELTGAD